MNRALLFRSQIVFVVLLVLLAPLLMAAILLQDLPPATQSAIVLVITLVLGLLGPKPIDWIKKIFNVEGLAAFRLVLLLSAIVAVAGMALGGYFFGFQLTAENILAAFGVFLAAVTYAYKALNPEPQT